MFEAKRNATIALVVLLLSGSLPDAAQCFILCRLSYSHRPALSLSSPHFHHHHLPSNTISHEHQGEHSLVSLGAATTTFDIQTSSARFNFGPVSHRDTLLYTCERPGNTALNDDISAHQHHHDHHDDNVVQQEMLEWKSHVIDKHGITHVIVLLDENELEHYGNNTKLLETFYRKQCHQHQVLVQPMRDPGAATRIWEFMEQAITTAHRHHHPSENNNNNNKIVAHCTGGVGRAGRVAAGWLVHQYGLTPEEATTETLQVATEFGIKRKGHADMLREWLSS